MKIINIPGLSDQQLFDFINDKKNRHTHISREINSLFIAIDKEKWKKYHENKKHKEFIIAILLGIKRQKRLKRKKHLTEHEKIISELLKRLTERFKNQLKELINFFETSSSDLNLFKSITNKINIVIQHKQTLFELLLKKELFHFEQLEILESILIVMIKENHPEKEIAQIEHYINIENNILEKVLLFEFDLSEHQQQLTLMQKQLAEDTNQLMCIKEFSNLSMASLEQEQIIENINPRVLQDIIKPEVKSGIQKLTARIKYFEQEVDLIQQELKNIEQKFISEITAIEQEINLDNIDQNILELANIAEIHDKYAKQKPDGIFFNKSKLNTYPTRYQDLALDSGSNKKKL